MGLATVLSYLSGIFSVNSLTTNLKCTFVMSSQLNLLKEVQATNSEFKAKI